MAIFYTDSASFNDVELTGSIRVSGSFSLAGSSLVGTSSWANNVDYVNVANKPALVSASIQIDHDATTNYLPNKHIDHSTVSISAGDGLSGGGDITTTRTVSLDTASAHFTSGVKAKLNTDGIFSSSNQVSYTGLSNIPPNIASSSAQVVSFIVGQAIAPSIVSASIISASTAITSSTLQLKGLTDTNATNKVLVFDTTTHTIFTTGSVGGGGGGNAFGTIAVAGQSDVIADQTNDTLTLVAGTNVTITTDTGTDSITINSTSTPFPYNGDAVITGSLTISGSIDTPLLITGSFNTFFEIDIINADAGNAASADVVASNNATTEFGNFIDMGINSTTYNAGLVGTANDGYLFLTSSGGELHVGNASIGTHANVRLFAGGSDSDATTRVFISSSGEIGIGTSTPRKTLDVVGGAHISGSDGLIVTGSITSTLRSTAANFIAASSGSLSIVNNGTPTLDLSRAGYFYASASGTGTAKWTASNAAATGYAEAFLLEYLGGGQLTNVWFAGIRWPGGTAPTLSSTGTDILGFSTDDGGTIWRGALLQRNSS